MFIADNSREVRIIQMKYVCIMEYYALLRKKQNMLHIDEYVWVSIETV